MRWLLLSVLLILGLPAAAEYRDALENLPLDPSWSQLRFERSSLRALNVHDPLEPLNRRIYRFNSQLDRHVLVPVVRSYEAVIPRLVRTGIHNLFANIEDVPNLANSLAQGKLQQGMRTTARLLFNTVLGLGGLIDVADRMGLPREPEDFGQTLALYGVPAGPYLVLPLLGPSSLRDTTGLITDWGLGVRVDLLGQNSLYAHHPETWLLYVVDLRYSTPFRYGQLDSPFEYDQVRYLYLQLRELQSRQ